MHTVTGLVQQIMPKVTGQGKNGEWGFVPVVIKTTGEYPKQIHFEVWDKKDKKSFKNADGVSLCGTMVNIGDTIEVMYDLESKSYNDKWFTKVSAYGIKVAAFREGQTALKEVSSNDDLPF